MTFSHFGDKFTGDSGIVSLMEDLGAALNVNPDLLFLGGGNPALVPEFERCVAEHLQKLAADPEAVHKLVGVYQSPQGSEAFIASLVEHVNSELGWQINASQVAITNGSQSAFFMLLNIFSGTMQHAAGEAKRHVVFPMMPEYLGYADQTKEHNVFRSFPPKIEYTAAKRFKYRIDFEAFRLQADDGAVCVSCPTNPTGNVLAADEMTRLSELTKAHNVPLIIDCAYGAPFPGIHYEQASLPYADHHIYVMSCSKLGLPGVRTGIVIASAELIRKLVNMNTIMSLANGNFGPNLMTSIMQSGKLAALCRDILLPFYRQRRDFMVRCVERYFDGCDYYMHEPQGAFFLWLWFPTLPISASVLYERLKEKGVLIMSGEHFFFAASSLAQTPEATQRAMEQHSSQCIRLTYCQDEGVIDQAIQVLAAELKSLLVA